MDVDIERLRFEHDRRPVLDIPSLRIPAGRTTAILGPNGSGKTTLLRLIAGLERSQAGLIRAGGRPSYVFQEQVFLRRSVRENLDLALELWGVHKQERPARIDEAAQQLAVGHLLDRQADRLSGGEGRRVSLARALCLRAPLVLLDEPLAGLDATTYSRLLDELPQLLRAFGATTLLVTHSRDEALRLGEHLVVLVDGRVRAAGDKHDVMLNPTDLEVAELLGYSVLATAGRQIAVAPGSLRVGPGPFGFGLVVEEVIDLVDHREIVGRIGGVRVRVGVPSGGALPLRGDHLLVHASRACEIGAPVRCA